MPVVTWQAMTVFTLAILPLALTPGASLALVSGWTLQGRPHAARSVIAGTATGIYLHALLAALGLSAVVMTSARTFTAVKLAGAAYLVGLGAWMLWSARRRRDDHSTQQEDSAHSAPRAPWSRLPAYPQAGLANALNPKAALVYLTLAPQFLDPARAVMVDMLALATCHVAVMALWTGGWSAALRHVRSAAPTVRFGRAVQCAGGAVLIGLGVRTAISR